MASWRQALFIHFVIDENTLTHRRRNARERGRTVGPNRPTWIVYRPGL